MRRFVSLLALCGGLLAAVCIAPSTVSAREPGQEIIRCGQQTPIKGSPRFFTGTVRIDPLYAANNAMRSSGGSVCPDPAPAPTGISILWDRCSSSPPGSA